jgi:hypothetical protein
VLAEKVRRYRSVFARDPKLPLTVGFVVESERRARTIHELADRCAAAESRLTFVTAVDEQLRRDPLGGLWSDGGTVRPTRDLAPLPAATSSPILLPGCLSDGDVLAALDDRGAATLPALGSFLRA